MTPVPLPVLRLCDSALQTLLPDLQLLSREVPLRHV